MDSAMPALLLGLSLTLSGLTDAAASEPDTPSDCSGWTLDGYRLGMRGDELLAVRSLTLHMEGQAQAIEPGRFHGVLVLDVLNNLKKWDVVYDRGDGTALRAEMRQRFGEPASDISGSILENDPTAGRQRRTIWWSSSCDVAMIIYESTSEGGTASPTVSAVLARASSFPPGLVQKKTLFR